MGSQCKIQRIYTCKPICWHSFYRLGNDRSPSLLMPVTHVPGGLERLPVAGVFPPGTTSVGDGSPTVSPTVETGKCFTLIYKAEQLCVIIP